MMDSKKRPFSGLFPDDLYSNPAASATAAAVAAASDPDATGCRNSFSHSNGPNQTPLLHHRRAVSPAPTGRFTLRRSSIATTSSSSSSFRSRSSEFKSFFSCVTRQTLPDECARYRFIAWVAAKRNECQHMNAVDKLECPLLRCRKRLNTHEELIKHIFDCEHLAGGEYWCFEHHQAERFDDGKCKGCCGHPTRRRKILSMARTFFSNLGHKSKGRKDHLSVDNDGVFLCPPPSYESLHQELPTTNEIFELPSPEPVQAQTVSPPELAPEVQSLAISTNFIQACPPQPDERQAPLLLVEEEEERDTPCSARPSLQLNTLVGRQKPVRPPPAPRSKHLSPSSSVRSTTSTTSTTSTVSTTSTQSLVSPISAWSELSVVFPKVSSLSDPPSVLAPEDLRVDTDMGGGGDLPAAGFTADFSTLPDISELPAEEFSMDLPAEIPEPETVDLSALGVEHYTFDPEIPASSTVMDSALFAPRSIAHEVAIPSHVPQPLPDELPACSSPKTLVDSAWGTLGEQLTQSVSKLKDVENNPLAIQLKCLDVKEVARIGLETLESMLQSGQKPDNPTRALCLAHLIYAFSVPVYEKHAMSRYERLFCQALVNVQELPEESRAFYKEVVSVLWQPQNVRDDVVEQYLARQQVESLSRTSSLKGKGREPPADARTERPGSPFVAVVQDFFDDLEAAVMFNPKTPTDAATSDLRETHSRAQGHCAKGQNVAPFHTQHDLAGLGPFAQRAVTLVNMLKMWFPDIDNLHQKLNFISARVSSDRIRSARKTELEVLRAGKCCLDPSLFFDKFVPRVRGEVDALYKHQPNNPFPRLTFHLKDLAVVKSIMAGLNDIPTADQPADYHDWFNDFVTAEAPHTTQLPPPSLNHENPNFIPASYAMSTPNSMPPLALPHTSPSAAASSNPSYPVSSSSPDIPLYYTSTDPQGQDYTFASPPPTQGAQSLRPHPQSPLQSHLQPQQPQLVHHQQTQAGPSSSSVKVESTEECEICGYRPKGDPRWFQGSMAKHRKTKHSAGPDKVYKCPYPGCQSAYKNREDNLKQHMKEKNHYVTGDEQSRRPSKRKKVS